ncbi:hypothetical protein Tco_1335290, partial [Tanacetum coccineum]
SDRLIPDKGDLRDYWLEISSNKYFLGPAPSYVLIRDPVRRLYHMMIAYSISGRGHALEKVTEVDLFYLRSMDHKAINVVTRELLLIDLHELERFYICTRYGDTWAWVAQGPERQQAAVAGAPKAGEDGQCAEEVAPEIPAPTLALVQAPPPAPQPRTMS